MTSDSPRTVSAWLSLVMALCFSTGFSHWIQPNFRQWGGLIGLSATSALAQWTLGKALQSAPISKLLPAGATKPLFTFLFGFLWFHEVPSLGVLWGSVLIFTALYRLRFWESKR